MGNVVFAVFPENAIVQPETSNFGCKTGTIGEGEPFSEEWKDGVMIKGNSA
jgi:hypothetical protein